MKYLALTVIGSFLTLSFSANAISIVTKSDDTVQEETVQTFTTDKPTNTFRNYRIGVSGNLGYTTSGPAVSFPSADGNWLFLSDPKTGSGYASGVLFDYFLTSKLFLETGFFYGKRKYSWDVPDLNQEIDIELTRIEIPFYGYYRGNLFSNISFRGGLGIHFDRGFGKIDLDAKGRTREKMYSSSHFLVGALEFS